MAARMGLMDGDYPTQAARRQFFDRLCQLQALYRLRGDYDATSAISIAGAVAHAEYRVGRGPRRRGRGSVGHEL